MSGKWSDLAPRVASGVVMAVVGFLAVWAGGWWFIALIAVACGLMLWELARMIAPNTGAALLQTGMLGFVSTVLAAMAPVFYALPVLLAACLVGASLLKKDNVRFVIYCASILFAGYGFIALREDLGAVWMLWLVLLVVATDVAGYFAGRIIGGPKFWPRYSPKKTWSGAVAGWVAAALASAVFVFYTNMWSGIIIMSVLLSFSSQIGDIAQSALKRRTGVKDSSAIIPGHGGVFDRFDGMIGASLCLIVLRIFIDLTPAIQ